MDDFRGANAGLSPVEGPASAVREDCPEVSFEVDDPAGEGGENADFPLSEVLGLFS